MVCNNFYISDIHGRYNSLLRKSEYSALGSCKSLDEIILKLNHYFFFINEDMTYDELRSKFVKNVMQELTEFNNEELVYFLEYYMISNFFNKMDGVREHPIGSFPELKALDLCKNFNDVQKLCISNCFLKKYFLGINNYDKQKTMLIVIKNYMDEMYIKAKGYFKIMLEYEGDRQILEICLNIKTPDLRKQYFPKATTLSIKELEKISMTSSLEDVKAVFGITDQNPIEFMVQKLNIVYSAAFRQFNDEGCIYAYFKLKEQEIENIMWIIECILQNVPEKASEIILFD